jgi:arsenate reductase
MADWQIYHNPRCSKSRAALQLLDEHEIKPEVVLYLKTPPTPSQLKSLLKKLKLKPRDIVRTKEPVFRQLKLDLADDSAVLSALAENPVLIERPIVVHGDRAVLGRPTEKVLELLQ